jgi:Iron/manganese superoxide dismutases, alpha-hairpin domain
VADYTLPHLPYDYAALEPHIAGKIMELHHSKHHATYVKGANTALEQLADARQCEALATVNMLEKNLAFNLGGHVNHSVFWPNMSPTAATNPTANSPLRSTSTSDPSTDSASISPLTRWGCRDPGGRFWRGNRWASVWSCSRFMTTKPTSRPP